MEIVFSLLILSLGWGAVYYAVRFGVRDAMRDVDAKRDRSDQR
jgi:hypothetical protein